MADARPSPRDQRIEHRAYGVLDLSYHRGRVADVAEWMLGRAVTSPARTPDPLMNFSGLGLAFDDVAGCVDGEILLLDFAVPGEPGRWRAAGKVLRVSPIPIDEREEDSAVTTRVAVMLIAQSADGEEALRGYTARVRQANGKDV